VLLFYKMPLGQKLIWEEPAEREEGLKHVQDWADGLTETVIVRIRTEMQKKSHPLR
jgi:hypothetical protein